MKALTMVGENKEPWGYLNGRFDTLSHLTVSVMDRGFIYGDGCYEVIPAYYQRPFLLKAHLERWRDNLTKIAIPQPLTLDEITNIIHQLLSLSQENFSYIYLQATRGTYLRREHVFPQHMTPTIFAYAMPFSPPSVTTASQGISVITTEDIRWQRCDIKSISLLANVLLRQKAFDANAEEIILLRNGFVTEGAVSNVFIVKSNIIKTPPLSQYLLPGITRNKVIEVARNLQLPCVEEPLSENALIQADEIWVTSSTKDIVPVSRLNGRLLERTLEMGLWRCVFEALQKEKG